MVKWIIWLILLAARVYHPPDQGQVALYQRDHEGAQWLECVPFDVTETERYRTVILVYASGWTVGWECDSPQETEDIQPTPTPDGPVINAVWTRP